MAHDRFFCVGQAAATSGMSTEDLTQIADSLMADKADVLRAQAEGRISNVEESLAQAWHERMDRETMKRALEKKHAALNIIKRGRLDEGIDRVIAEDFDFADALEGLLVGSNKRFTGARDSIDFKQKAIFRDMFGGMQNELERMGQPVLGQLKRSKEFNLDVVREMFSPESTGKAEARAVADIFSRYLEMARQRLNEAGANIGKLDGYVPQSHDPWKLPRKTADGSSPREAWSKLLLETLDMERTFPEIAGDATAVREALNEIYSNITLGREQGPNALEKGDYAGPPNMANSLGQHRVLHFKDADSLKKYNDAYGRSGLYEGMVQHLNAASRKLALMETLGPNPERMLRSLMAERERLYVESLHGREATPGELKTLERMRSMWSGRLNQQGKAWAWFEILTGEANWPLNTTWSRRAAIARSVQSMAKLGGASLSAIADVFIKASGMRVNGVSWGEALTGSLGQYFQTYKGDKKALARQLGAFADSAAAEFNLRWDMHDNMPGRMATLQNKFFKWSGLNYITESGKAGYTMWLSEHIGSVAGLAFDELPAAQRALLEYHGFDAKRWELLRRMTHEFEGKTMITPQAADALPDEVLRGYLADRINDLRRVYKNNPEGFAQAERRLLDRARRDLRTDAMTMYVDEAGYAILEPDAKTRATMYQGTRP
ncbi:MAG: hypothetical protein LBM64_10295, partial [Deltaproteobacteria bacterium]|nr:hypothetical protein [Deltaproteobacteria bacterium]